MTRSLRSDYNTQTTTEPATTVYPESWFTDYAASGAYAMSSLSDYLTARLTGIDPTGGISWA